MDGWMDGWTDRRMDGWMDGWMDSIIPRMGAIVMINVGLAQARPNYKLMM